MKKTGLFLSLGLALLASCANDDLVNPVSPENQSDLTPIGFNIRVNNMSRANPGLETAAVDFGVWAYKGISQTAAFENVTDNDMKPETPANDNITTAVMKDYLVGFFSADNKGYVPTESQNDYNTGTGYNWYYTGLGSTEKKFTWVDYGTFTSAATSRNACQYLKYWDEAATYHYFYGYAPYDASVDLKYYTVGSDSYPSLSFGAISGQTTTLEDDGKVTISGGTTTDYMYACAREASASHPLVNLNFTRLMSQIRIAFYETVPGYKVELEGLSTDYPGVVMVPTIYDATKTPAYTSEGAVYTTGGTPTVYFTEDATAGLTANVVYATPTTSTANIYYPYFWLIQADNSHSALVGHGADNKRYGETINVIPANSAAPNCGFTLNVSLKFTAEDTGEVFHVYGARVFVPASATQWEANKRYTYVFKISTGVSGDTGTPDPEPGVGPNPSSALIPIIFEDVTIQDITEVVNGEYNL